MLLAEDCIGCGLCVPYCPMGAIHIEGEQPYIDQDECVECNACLRAGVCPADALVQPELKWPRSIRRELSDPAYRNSTTGVAGRGTAEMKTNDVTGRYLHGQIGVGIEVGRPGLGTKLRDVEKIAMMIAAAGFPFRFEEKNPCTSLMEDTKTGKFKEEVLNEKVLSIIIEFVTDTKYIPEIMKTLEKAAKVVDTVFSVSIITRAEDNGTLPNVEKLIELGYQPSLNAKVNVGLGRPLPQK